MESDRTLPPEADVLEVSVFGLGYGESIVVHVGDGQWLVIDSCVADDRRDQSVAETYLTGLGVDLASAVRLIVATHWHDDHIRGLARLIRKCLGAKFVCSGALRAKEFFNLIEAYREPLMASSGVDEFRSIVDHHLEQKAQMAYAIQDRTLWKGRLDAGHQVSVIALSPSDRAKEQAVVSFFKLIPNYRESKCRLSPQGPNHTSVVLAIQAGEQRVLLGADLETTGDPRTGWTAVLEHSQCREGPASFFKVPHHGSANAHHDRVWQELLLPDSTAAVTSFCRGTVCLPRGEDIARIAGLTPHAYSTGAPKARPASRTLSKAVQRTLKEMGTKLLEVPMASGQVRARRSLVGTAEWQIELFGAAAPLRDLMSA